MFYAILKDKVFTPNQYLNDANRRYCFVSFSFGFRQLNTIQSHLRFLVTPRSCQENPIFADSQVLNGSNLEVKHKWWESKVQHKQSAKRNSFIHLQVAVFSFSRYWSEINLFNRWYQRVGYTYNKMLNILFSKKETFLTTYTRQSRTSWATTHINRRPQYRLVMFIYIAVLSR